MIKAPSIARGRTALIDLAVAVAVTVPPLYMSDDTKGDLSDPVIVAVGFGAFVLLFLRRRHPLPVLVVAVVAAAWTTALAGAPTPIVPAVLIVLYTVAASTDRATAVGAGLATAVVLFTVSAMALPTSTFNPQNVQLLAWSGLAAAAGDAVRSRRAYRRESEERIARAEQAVDEEARRRVVEERLHIARELHDVVAHHIAVINVQAAVAAHLLSSDPDGAGRALEQVRRGGRSVLDEMGGILSVLRDVDAPAGEPLDPLPGLDRLEELIRSFDAAGVTVELETVGCLPALSATVSLTIYRIVEESLTNVHKHGAGAGAHVRLVYDADAVTLEVRNVGGPAPLSSERVGNGTIGMMERVATMGGTLDRGPTETGFRVKARLPLRPETR